MSIKLNVHASRRAPTDRADANEVGPIKVEVIEPLHALRVQVDAPEHGLRADLTFVRRSAPIEEPHFFHQVGVRVMFEGGARFVMRLSGTGTEGATLRLYLERYAPGPEGLDLDPQEALAPVIAAAEAIAGIALQTGRTAPDVVT